MEKMPKEPSKLMETLEGHMTQLKLSRWLSTVSIDILMLLAQWARPRVEEPPEDMTRLVKAFMIAEGVMRPGETEPPLNFYIRRLGECACAEYAYRRDWLFLNGSLSLLTNPAQFCVPTRTGRVMSQVTGRESPLTLMVD